MALLEKASSSGRKRKIHWSKIEKIQQIAENLTSTGLTAKDLAGIFGIDQRTLSRAKTMTPELEDSIKEGKGKLHNMLVAQMVLAATGYDYTERCTKTDAEGRIKQRTIYDKRMPPNAQLFQFLMVNAFAQGGDSFPEGWRIRRVIDVNQNKRLKLDVSFDSKQIARFAGRLFGADTKISTKKFVDATEVVRPDSEGHRVQEGVPPVVPGETADILQERPVDIQSEGEGGVQEPAVHHETAAG